MEAKAIAVQDATINTSFEPTIYGRRYCARDVRGNDGGYSMTDTEERIQKLQEEIRSLRSDVDMLKTGKFDILKLSGGIQLLGSDAKLRAALMLLEDEPAFALMNKNGNIAMSITLDDGASDIALNDSSGSVRTRIKTDSDGAPMLVMNDTTESPRLSLSVVNGSPRLFLHDKDYKLRIAASLEPVPHIQIYDTADMPRINLSLDEAGPEICIIDETGQKIGGI